MLQHETPEDFTKATGRTISVRKCIEIEGNNLGWDKKNKSNGIIRENEGVMKSGEDLVLKNSN